MAANDYYDFKPSPTTWALMLTGFVLFVAVLSLLLILMVHRGAASGPAAQSQPPVDQLPAPRTADLPVARAS